MDDKYQLGDIVNVEITPKKTLEELLPKLQNKW